MRKATEYVQLYNDRFSKPESQPATSPSRGGRDCRDGAPHTRPVMMSSFLSIDRA